MILGCLQARAVPAEPLSASDPSGGRCGYSAGPIAVGAVGVDDPESPPAVVGLGHAPTGAAMAEWHETTPSANGTVSDHLEVAVIGGGQAGLAVGYFLALQGRQFAILKVDDEPAAAWRGAWDSLKLFTPARYPVRVCLSRATGRLSRA